MLQARSDSSNPASSSLTRTALPVRRAPPGAPPADASSRAAIGGLSKPHSLYLGHRRFVLRRLSYASRRPKLFTKPEWLLSGQVRGKLPSALVGDALTGSGFGLQSVSTAMVTRTSAG